MLNSAKLVVDEYTESASIFAACTLFANVTPPAALIPAYTVIMPENEEVLDAKKSVYTLVEVSKHSIACVPFAHRRMALSSLFTSISVPPAAPRYSVSEVPA